MTVSVITVSYNASEVIEKTIVSVINQDYQDFEYIVIDGGSNDGTVDIIKKYEERITKWISEPDSGIYEAMNKGVRLATGDYCIFMNAGDRFINDKVLSKVGGCCLDGRYLFLLGNLIYVNPDGRISGYENARGKICKENLYLSSISHQASFIWRDMLLEDPYDESLKLVSDWKFALKHLILGKAPSASLDIDVCYFTTGGATYSNVELGRTEREQVLDELISGEERERIKSMRRHVSLAQKIIYKLTFYFKVMQYGFKIR